MSYPTQAGVLKRLEAETRRAGRAHEDAMVGALKTMWKSTKANMRGIVMVEYGVGHRPGPWSLRTAGPTLARIGRHIVSELGKFHGTAASLCRGATTDAYRQEALRQTWMLDALTPPGRRPQVPMRALREAAADGSATWEEALDEWLRAYAATLGTNLRLEALHEGALTDAADEVDAARVGGYDPAYKFSALLTNQILAAQREARADVADANGDLVAEEIFQTMEDSIVCPDCDSQDGVPVEAVRVFGHVYGYNCRCYERIVPRAYAEMLRSGDAFDKEAALLADDRGLVPDAMVVAGPDGGLVGHFTVSFSDWMGSDRGMSISGRAGSGVLR